MYVSTEDQTYMYQAGVNFIMHFKRACHILQNQSVPHPLIVIAATVCDGSVPPLSSITLCSDFQPPSIPEAMVEGPVSTEEFLQMKKKLSTMEFRMQQILKTNQDLQKERDDLTQLVRAGLIMCLVCFI